MGGKWMNNFHKTKETLLEKKEKSESTQMYKVYIMGNWYNGKYFDYGGRMAIVPAKSERDAIEFTKKHKKEIIAYYDQAKINGRRILPKDIEKNIWLDKTHTAKLYTDQNHPGTFHKFIKTQESLSFNESAKYEVSVGSRQVSGVMSGFTYVFDSHFKEKPLKKALKHIKISGGGYRDFKKGDKVSNLPGGVFILTDDWVKDKWGQMIISSKENLESIAKAL
jgi:hypothetical protein